MITPSLFFSLKYDLFLGSHNREIRRSQKLVEKRLEIVKLFSFFKTKRIWNVKAFSSIELGFTLIFELGFTLVLKDLHPFYDNAWVKIHNGAPLCVIKCYL